MVLDSEFRFGASCSVQVFNSLVFLFIQFSFPCCSSFIPRPPIRYLRNAHETNILSTSIPINLHSLHNVIGLRSNALAVSSFSMSSILRIKLQIKKQVTIAAVEFDIRLGYTLLFEVYYYCIVLT